MTQIDWYLVFPRASSSGLVYPPVTPQSGSWLAPVTALLMAFLVTAEMGLQ